VPAIDSRDVNKQIRMQVKPMLKHEEFSNFTSRTAWRYHPHQIDVINFQSFNSYFAEVAGCTTYSFAVNLGCYFTYVPDMHPNGPIKVKKDRLIPEEFRCHARRQLRRQLPQPELERTDIWYVDPGGKYLGPAVYDAALTIDTEAWNWFEQWSDASDVLRELQGPDSRSGGGTHGFGANPSPRRSYLTAYTAIFLKRPDIAIPHFEQVLASRSFPDVKLQVERDLKNAVEANEGKIST
jgi:hypothetical protein